MSINNNVDKILVTYIKPVSVQYCDKLVIDKSIFQADSCAVCGRCCGFWDPIFLPFEVEEMNGIISGKSQIDDAVHMGGSKNIISDLVNSLEPISVNVEGKVKILYRSHLSPVNHYFSDRGNLKRCHWLVDLGDSRVACSIHQVSGLTCKFPHVRLMYASTRRATYVRLMQFGRNWALNCPVTFSNQLCVENGINVISKFKLLKKYCEYFEVENYCQNIIDAINLVHTEQDIDKVCGQDILGKRSGQRLF